MKHVKLFEQFINEEDKFTYADALDNVGEDGNDKDIANALKALKAKSSADIYILTDTTEDEGEGLFDEVKKMKEISISSPIYNKAYAGKYNGKPVVVFDDGEDMFAYTK